jgi:flagellar basal body rod protein FlgC
MKTILIFAIAFQSLVAAANSSNDCDEIKSEQVRLALVASNLSNANTTRTPEGGPYRPYKIKSCSNGGCDVVRDNRAPILKYLPDHPDANEQGYVPYPNIDRKNEYTTFNMTALKLKLLVQNPACGATVITDNGLSSFAIRYKGQNPDIKEDIFNLNKDQKVVSWMRESYSGAVTISNFGSDGEIDSKY